MKTPLLLLLFNRPELTKKLIARLKLIKPKKIYINIDGPRNGNLKDQVLCKEVLKLIKKIEWPCKKYIKINKTNKGCRKSVYNAITWAFLKENKLIILEDDCFPSNFFFGYCEQLLKKYKYENKIKVISGSNFQKNKFGEADYYFSKYLHCWGWATWKRAWKNYDNSMSFWKSFQKSSNWNDLFTNNSEKKYWKKKFDLVKEYKIDSWAYVWLASVWYNQGLTIIPNKNLVKNVGFESDATHTTGYDLDKYSREINGKKIPEIKHPIIIKNNKIADQLLFKHHFNGMYNFYPWRLIYLIRILINNPFNFINKVKKSFL